MYNQRKNTGWYIKSICTFIECLRARVSPGVEGKYTYLHMVLEGPCQPWRVNLYLPDSPCEGIIYVPSRV